MDIQYDKVKDDKDSFSNTGGQTENTIQEDNPENQFEDSIKVKERKKEK